MTLMPREFFARLSVPVAPDLLGCVLEHQTEAGLVAVELTEVEAYAGASDPASHAYHGKTARNAVMFGPPGHAYVYFTYGMHFCVNVVCLGNGSASAVLLRAGRIIEGEELARARRTRGTTKIPFRDLARGPARLCQALDIDRSLDGADVCVPDSPLRMRWPEAGTTARSAAVLARGTTPPNPPGKRSSAGHGSESRPRPRCRGGSGSRGTRPSRRTGLPCRDDANWLPPSDPSMAPCRRGRHHR